MFVVTKTLVTAASLVALIVTPAHADAARLETVQAQPGTPDNARIDISHVNLDSDREWNHIADTLREKAEALCEAQLGASDRRAAEVEECAQASYENGVAQMRDVLARRKAAGQTRLARF